MNETSLKTPVPLTAADRGLETVQTTAVIGIILSIFLLGHTTGTSTFFYAVMALCLVAYFLARGDELVVTSLEYLTSPTMVWRWAFTVWAVLSLLWTARGRVSVDRAITLVEIQVVGLVLYDAVKKLGMARLILGTAFVCAIIAGAQALITGIDQGMTRLAGLYASPNALGIVAVMGFASFCSGIGTRASHVLRVLSHLGMLVLFAAILASASLKSMASALFICVVSAFYGATRRRAGIIALLAGAAGTALVVIYQPLRVFWEHAIYRMHTSLATMGSSFVVSQSTSERTRFVREGISLIAEAPIVGRGLDTFRWLSGEGTYSHNNFVEVGVALGLIGVVLYYGFHFALLKSALARRRRGTIAARYTFILVSTLALLDIGLVSYTFKIPALLMIVCAGWMDRAPDADDLPARKAL